MKNVRDYAEEIHKCSKCGLCQSVCPIYKVTGNDCSVSRGQFIMLRELIKGNLKMTKKLNRYLSLCLKCGKCSEYCPSGIDAVDIIASAKREYYEKHFMEKVISFLQKYLFFGAFPYFVKIFHPDKKSMKFNKKVIYFGGCNSKFYGNGAIVKLLNKMRIEVIDPKFSCCGIPFYVRGDMESFKNYMNKYIKTLRQYDIKEIVTTCASCEKTIEDYVKWCDDKDREFLSGITVRNIYEYIKEKAAELKLKKPIKITYHKPCNQNNYDDIKYILNAIENLEYTEFEGYDNCCGLNGLLKISEYKIISNVCAAKRKSIISTNAQFVLTSCFGCETALKAYSFGKYKTENLTKFLADNLEL